MARAERRKYPIHDLHAADRRFARAVILIGSGLLLGVAAVAVAIFLGSGTLRLPSLAVSATPTPAVVRIERMMLPLVDGAGRLQGYATVDIAFETSEERRGELYQRLPQVRHAINLVAWRTRATLPNDPGRIDLGAMQAMIGDAAQAVLGPGIVHAVRVLSATPA